MSRSDTGAPATLVRGRWAVRIPEYPLALTWTDRAGDRLAMISAEGTLASIETVDGDGLWRVQAHKGGACTVQASPDGSTLASGGQDGYARLWDADQGEQLAEIALKGWVEHAAWAPNGEWIAVAAGRVVTLCTKAGTVAATWGDHPSTISSLAWRPDSAQLAVGHYGGVTLRAPVDERPIRRLERKGSILSVAWHPHGRHLAAGCQDQAVQVWNMRKSDHLYMSGYNTKLTSIAWSQTGRYLATAGGPGATIWDFSGKGPKGSRPLSVVGHEDLLTALAWAPTESLIVTADAAGGTNLSRITDKIVRTFARIDSTVAVSSVAWRPDGRGFVIAQEDGSVQAYDRNAADA